jgi:hypothetical protein
MSGRKVAMAAQKNESKHGVNRASSEARGSESWPHHVDQARRLSSLAFGMRDAVNHETFINTVCSEERRTASGGSANTVMSTARNDYIMTIITLPLNADSISLPPQARGGMETGVDRIHRNADHERCGASARNNTPAIGSGLPSIRFSLT